MTTTKGHHRASNVARKATAFTLWRAIDQHWNRNTNLIHQFSFVQLTFQIIFTYLMSRSGLHICLLNACKCDSALVSTWMAEIRSLNSQFWPTLSLKLYTFEPELHFASMTNYDSVHVFYRETYQSTNCWLDPALVFAFYLRGNKLIGINQIIKDKYLRLTDVCFILQITN